MGLNQRWGQAYPKPALHTHRCFRVCLFFADARSGFKFVCANLYIHMLRFEWDELKNKSNLSKHGISFEIAQFAFEDPRGISFVERIQDCEERWHLIGYVEDVMLILVVHTLQEFEGDELIRIISARRATRHERRLYEKANG